MKKRFIIAASLLLSALNIHAQASLDPIVMTISGQPVTRSEFEYSYNKNNSESVIDKKSVEEYVDLFVNYKLKVQAAVDAKMDTLSSFRKEFATYRDQQIRPAMINDADIDREARKIYHSTQHRIDSLGGLVKPAHILVKVRQSDSNEVFEAARATADSLYNVLKSAGFNEELFGEMAKRHSGDPGSAKDGGLLPWIQPGQTLPEFNEKIFSMNIGETSAPVKTAAGFHIIQLREKRDFFSYDSLRTNIYNFIEQRGIRNQIINAKIDSIAKASGEGVTPEMVLAEKREQMVASDPELKYLIQEYHDGLLLYEISNRLVWEKAANDEAGLIKTFKKNKKKYQWDAPRFKGIAYRTKDEADIEAVKTSIKKLAFDKWSETLRTTFNNDSVLRIRVEKGVFKKGDNAIVDNEVFDTKAKVKPVKGYPHTATFGKVIKKPEAYTDVKGLVVTDYQEELEKAWVAELRKKYAVEINHDILSTVNKH